MLATTEGERPILIVRDAWLLDLGRRPYREVWEWQKSLVDRRADDRIPDGLILVEHEPIATLGRRGKREAVLDPNLEIVEVERGGEATYHGPGQLVGYPILKLPDRLEVKQLVTDLEEVLIRTCRDFGIESTREGVELANQFRDDLEQVADDSVVGDLEERGLRVDVDDEDLLRLLHPGEVLYGATDADRDVELRPDRHPGLADLERLRDPSAVDRLARRGDRSAEPIRELLQHREVLRVGEPVSSAHDDVGLLRPQASFLRELLEFQERRVGVLRAQLDHLADDLAAVLRVVRWRNEHVPPDGGHLRPVLLAQAVGEAFPAETRPDHVEISFGVDVELDAVRGESGLQDRMRSAAEIPTVLRGAEEDDLRFVPPDELRHHLSVRTRSVDLEDRIVHDDHPIEAVADRLLGERVHAFSGEDSGEGRAAQVSEPPPFADQLCAHVAEVSRASLQEDPHTAEVGLVLESMAVRHGAITRSRIKASRRARTVSFGSPEKMWPARGGRRVVSTLANDLGGFSNPTFFGSMPTSAHAHSPLTHPRFTRCL